MGDKYASSLANLFMGKWEEDVINAPRRPEVVLWARYIDDILLLWDGCESDLRSFMTSLNNNDRGIKLNFEASLDEINFLDLKIKIVGDNFVTATFFIATNRNSYISLDSCHYDPWLKTVPLGQFLCLKRNCTEINTFDEQAAILSKRFIEKGYDQEYLSRVVKEARDRERSSLLLDRHPSREDISAVAPFITTFLVQH